MSEEQEYEQEHRCQCCASKDVELVEFPIQCVSDKTEPELFCDVCLTTDVSRPYIYSFPNDITVLARIMGQTTNMLLKKIEVLETKYDSFTEAIEKAKEVNDE